MEITFLLVNKEGEEIFRTIDTENELEGYENFTGEIESMTIWKDDGTEIPSRLTADDPKKWFCRTKEFTIQTSEIPQDGEVNFGFRVFLAKKPPQKVLEAIEGKK